MESENSNCNSNSGLNNRSNKRKYDRMHDDSASLLALNMKEEEILNLEKSEIPEETQQQQQEDEISCEREDSSNLNQPKKPKFFSFLSDKLLSSDFNFELDNYSPPSSSYPFSPVNELVVQRTNEAIELENRGKSSLAQVFYHAAYHQQNIKDTYNTHFSFLSSADSSPFLRAKIDNLQKSLSLVKIKRKKKC